MLSPLQLLSSSKTYIDPASLPPSVDFDLATLPSTKLFFDKAPYLSQTALSLSLPVTDPGRQSFASHNHPPSTPTTRSFQICAFCHLSDQKRTPEKLHPPSLTAKHPCNYSDIFAISLKMAFQDFLTNMDDTFDVEDSNEQACHDDTMEHLSRRARKHAELWACDICELLHEIDTNDIPLSSGMDVVYGQDHTDKMTHCAHKTKTHLSGITHHQVQMALKLTHLARTGRATNFKDYLKNLTEAYAISDKATMRRTSDISLTPRRDGLPNSFTPKIAKDQDDRLHFLLQTLYQLDTTQQSVRVDVCPHIRITKEQILSKRHSSSRCKHCATSYVSSAVQVRVFHDFGSESSPADLSWQAHLQSDVKMQGSERVRFGETKQTMESLFSGTAVTQNGSVNSFAQEKRVHNKIYSVLHKMKGAMKPALSFDF